MSPIHSRPTVQLPTWSRCHKYLINATHISGDLDAARALQRNLHKHEDPGVLPALNIAAGELRGGVASPEPRT
jgi:hypothetical protein